MSLIRRYNRYSARIRVPQEIRAHIGGPAFVQRALGTSDLRAAKAEHAAWEAELRMQWEALREQAGGSPSEPGSYRRLYLDTRQRALAGEFEVWGLGDDPVADGIDFEVDKMADEVGERELTPPESAKLSALMDAKAELRGEAAPVPPEYQAPFSEAVEAFMAHWKSQPGRKPTNTEKQLRATFRLFQGYWRDQPMTGITAARAARFFDQLRTLNPRWASTPANLKLPWDALIAKCGGHQTGLSPTTMNRHMSALGQLWKWAKRRDYCSGDDPFDGDKRRLQPSSIRGYQPWTFDELALLFTPPPRRQDLHEIMLVALYTGMRLNEIASLTWERVRREHGVDYFQIEDAKTPAGNRMVPVHPALAWLVARKVDDGTGRVWPRFRSEGPGGKPGGDAGKLFSAHKGQRGFEGRSKAFHSFRKNVVTQLEEKGVPENEVALLVGHAKQGFTFSTYGAKALALGRLAEIVRMIEYPAEATPPYSSQSL